LEYSEREEEGEGQVRAEGGRDGPFSVEVRREFLGNPLVGLEK
jgi:hypothetical protein